MSGRRRRAAVIGHSMVDATNMTSRKGIEAEGPKPTHVACTRARGQLLATGVDPALEFLDDLRI